MTTLVVEDDFTSRSLLQRLMSAHGPCDIAVDGKEAVEAFRGAWEEKEPYDLICLDVMMPEMDGHEALKEIRRLEAEKGIHGLGGVKIVMTTALDDHQNIMEAFSEQCDAYVTKPIRKEKLWNQIKSLGLL